MDLEGKNFFLIVYLFWKKQQQQPYYIQEKWGEQKHIYPLHIWIKKLSKNATKQKAGQVVWSSVHFVE